MRGINHALTGVVIGLASGNAIAALPISLASHFVCDAIPHFDFKSHKNEYNQRRFLGLLAADGLLCVVLIISLIFLQPQHWLLAVLCALLAVSPDLMWFPNFVRVNKGLKMKKERNIVYFHKNIQWFERPIGAVVEVVWAAGVLIIISVYV